MSTFTVYKHTSPSGKVYIGITCQRPKARWANGAGYKHSPHFLEAIKKYGWDNFEHTILAEGLSKEEAEAEEVALIAKYKSTDRRFGYNTDLGGSTGPKHTQESKAKIAQANAKRGCSSETRAKLRALKLAHPTTPETAQKIAEANRGRKHRPESIERIRAAQKKRPVRNVTTGALYDSLQDAARATGLEATKICKVCRGLRLSTGGYNWQYEPDKEVVV